MILYDIKKERLVIIMGIELILQDILKRLLQLNLGYELKHAKTTNTKYLILKNTKKTIRISDHFNKNNPTILTITSKNYNIKQKKRLDKYITREYNISINK